VLIEVAAMRAVYPLLFGACIFCFWKLASIYWPAATKRIVPWLGIVAGWAWCLFAGGGGLGILLIRGPWPPTNGWFALMSGVAACPLLGRLLQSSGRLQVSGWHQFAAACSSSPWVDLH
jgi:hypothetical protein